MRETAMISREMASPDYEQPYQNVADLKPPVQLPAMKARQGEMRGHVLYMLLVGTSLAVFALAIAYFTAL